MIRRRAALAAITGLATQAAVAPAAAADAGAAALDFIALGDMPYGNDLLSGVAYRHLIDQIDALDLPFAIHVGDFKAGSAPCSDAEYARQLHHFQRFARALVYTPGDNDWYDCQRQSADPLERLRALRRQFFDAGAQSLGQRPLALLRQGDAMPAHAAYVENQRWVQRDVVFATFHTVGPDNGSQDAQADVRAEAQAREAANAAWIRAAFAVAQQMPARALVLATQADLLGDKLPATAGQRPARRIAKGFELSISQTLLPLADAAPFPVLLIHGDAHIYTVDQPFRNARGQAISRLWRLQVFGEPQLHAVRVRVEPPGSPLPFGFSPVWNPTSTAPQTLRRANP